MLVAVGLVEPAAEAMDYLEIIERLLFRQGKAFVCGFVAYLADEVEGRRDVLRKQAATAEDVDTLGGVGAFRERDLIHSEHDFHHAFAEQAYLQ